MLLKKLSPQDSSLIFLEFSRHHSEFPLQGSILGPCFSNNTCQSWSVERPTLTLLAGEQMCAATTEDRVENPPKTENRTSARPSYTPW